MGLNYQNKIGVDPQLSTSLSIVADGWLIPIYKTCKPSVANCLTSLDNSWHCLTRDLQLLNSFLIRPWPIVVKFSNWVLFKQTRLVSSPAAQLRELTRNLARRIEATTTELVWGELGSLGRHIGIEMVQLPPSSEATLCCYDPRMKQTQLQTPVTSPGQF